MRYILALVMLFMSVKGMTQVLYVYHTEGNVTISKGRSKPEQVKGGLALEKGVVVNIPQHANIYVLNEAGLAVLINKPGKYSYEEIKIEIGKSTEVASPFFAHVWKKLKEHHGHDPNALGNAPKGGVSRAEWVVSLPDTLVILSNQFVLSWSPVSEKTFFKLANDAGKTVLKIALSDTVVTVFPYEMQLARGEYYTWTLSKDLSGNQGVSGVIFVPTTEWIAAFRKEEEQLKVILSRTNDPAFAQRQLDYFYQTRKIRPTN